MLLEFDLSGAEWHIVAYLSGDENMMAVAKSGKSPHGITGSLMTGVPEELVLKEDKELGHLTNPEEIAEKRRELMPEIFDLATFLPRVMTIRQMGKKSNHGMNYGVKYRTFALVNELEETAAMRMVDLYNKVAYPGLPEWREREQREFKANKRVVTNLLGRKVRLMDKPGPDLWNAICAFKPQSTVADVVRIGLQRVYNDRSELAKHMWLLAPVHDSILLDYPSAPVERLAEFVKLMQGHMTVPLNVNGYDFTLKVATKGGHNWGEMKSWEQIQQELSPSS